MLKVLLPAKSLKKLQKTLETNQKANIILVKPIVHTALFLRVFRYNFIFENLNIYSEKTK